MLMLKRILIAGAVLIIVGVAYYGISPLFRNISLEEAAPSDTQNATTSPQMEEVPQMMEQAFVAASIEATAAHPASGTARLISADGKFYVRYENYKTINGPDLYVYLAKDTDAKEFVSLGRLKATEGNFNYEIPAGVDPAEYPYVLTWCKAFGVLFNSAKIN